MIDVADLRSRRRTPGVPTAGERRTAGAVAAVSLVALAVAGALFAGAAAHLPDAHLYRQATGEGLKFAAVFLVQLVATALAVPALISLAVSSTRLHRPGRIVARVVAGAAAVAVVAAWAATFWVEWHGDRCIGACI